MEIFLLSKSNFLAFVVLENFLGCKCQPPSPSFALDTWTPSSDPLCFGGGGKWSLYLWELLLKIVWLWGRLSTESWEVSNFESKLGSFDNHDIAGSHLNWCWLQNLPSWKTAAWGLSPVSEAEVEIPVWEDRRQVSQQVSSHISKNSVYVIEPSKQDVTIHSPNIC